MSLNTACRYAWECQTPEGGWGLDSVLREASWKLRGIVNGIDYSEWSPQADKFLRSDGYRNYDLDSMREGKAACKAALQRVCKSPSSSPPSLLLLLDLPSIETFLLHACLPVCVRSRHTVTDLNPPVNLSVSLTQLMSPHPSIPARMQLSTPSPAPRTNPTPQSPPPQALTLHPEP